MTELGRLIQLVEDTAGNAVVNAQVNVLKQGAFANGGQVAVSTITVFDPGGIVAGDTVSVNFAGAQRSVSSVTATTVVITGTLTVSNLDRLTVNAVLPTIYSDAQSVNAIANPILTSSTGLAACSLRGGYYDVVTVVGAATTVYPDVYVAGDTITTNILDAASAVGYIRDTARALATSGAKHTSFRVNAVEQIAIDKDGALVAPTPKTLASVADGATAVGAIVDTSNSLVTAGAKILSVRTAGSEKFSVDYRGGLIAAGGAIAGTDADIVAHPTILNNPVTNDQAGLMITKFGAVSDFGSTRIIVGISGSAAPQFTFTAPKGGTVLGVETSVLLQGAAVGGSFTGSLRGAYSHVDFSGVGNGTTITNVYGHRADVGTSGSGSGYTVTNAAVYYAGTPSAANIGTITNSHGVYSELDVAVGGTFAAPKGLINASGDYTGRRLVGNQGTTLVAADWTFSAGWGTTAGVAIQGPSKDTRGAVTITSSGTGQAANPTLTLTFKDGAFAAAPFAFGMRQDNNAPTTAAFTAISSAPTACTFQFYGTPVAATSYSLNYIVIG